MPKAYKGMNGGGDMGMKRMGKMGMDYAMKPVMNSKPVLSGTGMAPMIGMGPRMKAPSYNPMMDMAMSRSRGKKNKFMSKG